MTLGVAVQGIGATNRASSRLVLPKRDSAGVLDEPYSAKPAQRSSHNGPPGCIWRTRFQPMWTDGPVRHLRWPGLAVYKVRLKLPPPVTRGIEVVSPKKKPLPNCLYHNIGWRQFLLPRTTSSRIHRSWLWLYPSVINLWIWLQKNSQGVPLRMKVRRPNYHCETIII